MTSDESTGLTPVFTFVLWTSCLAVGVAGLLMPYQRPRPPASQPPPVQAVVLHVDLLKNDNPPPAAQTPALPAEPTPPDVVPPAQTPPSPPLTAVAVPTPAIAFALPVKGPTRIVPAKQAVPAPVKQIAETQTAPVAPAPPAVQQITYGQGEGQQPAPEYPREAVLAHQQGAVLIRFSVDADGNVTSADAIAPSPWPLLNQAALRAVRETWRFHSGSPRTYEVSIQFQLKRR